MSQKQAPPSLVIVNARVWTGDPRRPWADAIVASGDRVALVGSGAEARKMATVATRVIDARGGMVLPGFIDAHVHFLDGGARLSGVQLRSADTPAEFGRRIRAHASSVPAGTWITGGDWDHERWGGELPRRDWIDDATPDHPVWVHRLDGHMSLANTAALRAAGISRESPDVPGGTIVRDAAGEPTGLLKDNAQAIVGRAVPTPTDAERDRALEAAMAFVASNGVTSVHNMGSLQVPGPFADLDVFERFHRDARLRTRIYAATPLAEWEQLRDRIEARGRGDHWLRIGAVKGFVDGSLGSHTAAMLEPYADDPRESGLLVNDLEDLHAWIAGADEAGLHSIVHAIGDRANRLLLDLYARIGRDRGPRDRRFRVEHAQHLHADDIPRFASLGVIASMQPYHAIDDGRWAERVVGTERARTTYAFRSLMDSGATVAFGSDWFVAPPTPLEGIYAAVTRRTLDGRHPDGWVPDQRITVEAALRAYTAHAAYASFEESVKGTLERGKLADLVLIDRDLTRVAPESLREAAVLMTVVGGAVVHDRVP